MTAPVNARRTETRAYVAGFALALALTGASFAIVHWQSMTAMRTFGTVLALALLQAIVHFHFFLQVGFKKQARDHLLLLLFSTLIIALMVSGTLVLMFNLRLRMM